MHRNVLIEDAYAAQKPPSLPMCTPLCHSHHIHGPMIYMLIPNGTRYPGVPCSGHFHRSKRGDSHAFTLNAGDKQFRVIRRKFGGQELPSEQMVFSSRFEGGTQDCERDSTVLGRLLDKQYIVYVAISC